MMDVEMKMTITSKTNILMMFDNYENTGNIMVIDVSTDEDSVGILDQLFAIGKGWA